MTVEDDSAIVMEQERALRLDDFSVDDAWAIGCDLRRRALDGTLPILIDIRTWDGPLFTLMLPGATPDNAEWVARKLAVVRRFQMSSYRKGLDLAMKGWPEANVFGPLQGVDPADFAPHGGAFPLALRGGLIFGAVTVSGLPQREDHNLVVEALAAWLGRDVARLTDRR